MIGRARRAPLPERAAPDFTPAGAIHDSVIAANARHHPMPEMCVRLGEVLGMDKPVPMPVLCARSRTRLRRRPHHLARPAWLPGALLDDRTALTRRRLADAPSATALAGKAAAAMLRWGKAGFSTVDSETLERRESACLGCPNLAIRERGAEDGAGAPSPTRSAAGWAGLQPVRLRGPQEDPPPTEACPDTHPVKSGLTRWDEPIPPRPCRPERRRRIDAAALRDAAASIRHFSRRHPRGSCRPPLRDHHGRRIGIARGDQGHDGGVGDAQPFQPCTRRRASTTAPWSGRRPIAQVPTGWKMVVPILPAAWRSSSSLR